MWTCRIGWAVQRACLRVPQRAFCFSRLHAQRLREAGLADVTVLEGQYAGDAEPPAVRPAEPLVVFAGRHIPEKQATAVIPAFARVRKELPELRCEIYGDGPDRAEVLRLIAEQGLEEWVTAPGFVEPEQIGGQAPDAERYQRPERAVVLQFEQCVDAARGHRLHNRLGRRAQSQRLPRLGHIVGVGQVQPHGAGRLQRNRPAERVPRIDRFIDPADSNRTNQLDAVQSQQPGRFGVAELPPFRLFRHRDVDQCSRGLGLDTGDLWDRPWIATSPLGIAHHVCQRGDCALG